MAERKSVNKYYPPDWDPSKGSVNNYVGQHPLRDRAKKLGQGILVIRFEMPYNIWCGGCKAHIGMGVRYNAEKSKTGNYYTTPIYKFRMKCHLCDNYFEMQTDPKNHDYVILEGARRKEQRWDPKENEQIVPEDKATQKKLATDAMFKLEHGTDDKKRGKQAVSNLALLESSKDIMKEDYMLNKMARNMFREEKKQLKKVREDDDALLKKSSLDIPLLKEKEEDIKLAGLIRLRSVESYDEKQAQKRKYIESRPMFLAKKRPLDAAADLPHAKKLRIIKDNILKAKVNASISPFDRKKTTTIGIGLTKNQLGIRQKSSCNSTSLQKQNESKDKDKTNLNNSTHLNEQNSEVDINTDIDYLKSSHKSHENKDSQIDNQKNKTYCESGTKHLEHNCVNKTSACDASSTFETNESNKCMNEEESKTETYNNVLNNRCSTDLLEISSMESNIIQSTKEGPFIKENNEINTKNNNPVTIPSLSLVAAYSDSEDTDSSAV